MLYPLLYSPLYAYRGVRRALLLAARLVRSVLPFLLWITSEVLWVASIALLVVGWALLTARLWGAMDPGPWPDPSQWRVFIPAFAWLGVAETAHRVSAELSYAHDKLTGVEQ